MFFLFSRWYFSCSGFGAASFSNASCVNGRPSFSFLLLQEVDTRWLEYQNQVESLVSWIKQHTIMMSDKSFPQNPVELKVGFEYISTRTLFTCTAANSFANDFWKFLLHPYGQDRSGKLWMAIRCGTSGANPSSESVDTITYRPWVNQPLICVHVQGVDHRLSFKELIVVCKYKTCSIKTVTGVIISVVCRDHSVQEK